MGEQAVLPHGVMEGKGSYNRHATIPTGGGALAIPALEDAARKIAVEPVDQPLMIADYGSSQGKNSQAPMRAALQNLRGRIGSDRAVFVFHIDQPSNDFNSLFEVMSSDADRYTAGEANVFPCGIGRSFYEQVLPAESVHLGWCSYAAVWLSRIPGLIPGHFLPVHTSGPGRAAFFRQAAEDWEAFLTLRARELRRGGRLVLVFPGRNDEGLVGLEHLIDHANAALGEMVDSGEIRAEERERMVVVTYPRQKSELLAPFEGGREFRGLRVEHYELLSLPDAAWPDYRRDGDSEALATKHALFFRAIFVPSLASSLDRVRAGDSVTQKAFADRLQERLVRRPS
jgi:hypothetical protein